MIERLMFGSKNSVLVDCIIWFFLVGIYLPFALADAEIFNGFFHEKIYKILKRS